MSQTLAGLSLYHYASCPFCHRVSQFFKHNQIAIEERDILQNTAWREELLLGGGKTQVPCLKIERSDGSVEWLYESMDIMRYVADKLDESP